MRKKLHKYLQKGRLLQLATSGEAGPWVCTVYYVVDAECNLYWLSLPTRRHSTDIANDNRVAATVVIEPDLPVVGVQMEGIASTVSDHKIVKHMSDLYIQKYDAGKTFYDRFMAGDNHHRMYRLTPTSLYLFDERTTSISDRQLVV